MPIYEYKCGQCSHQMDKLQKMSDAPLTDCPACGEPALNKMISAAGFRLSGSGWYESDFKSGEKRNMAESSKEVAPAAPACATGGCGGCG
ncbi:MAG: zinc ribbon domain-containing protein [Gammaproteobacteria bacterium]|jgi:putative FmdB family regulatory protein|nr:zinc ribbon domain-containing protein [Gammaproteobacteria bacterium]